ncbi:SusC/RagA family TonB-linked outer membrane protein [Flexithrix dorotheae]|uniref:SusC/RagA family TonB-linked outer membrane protein n=1 Tax=Flexithrix dorotheae TaxID=70993 RepID=UPI000378C3CD|nr:SusC/RagA family TonB-linked outer membrane protein [Flexithrix dorotheae]
MDKKLLLIFEGRMLCAILSCMVLQIFLNFQLKAEEKQIPSIKEVRVNLSMKNASLPDFFTDIEHKTEFKFAYGIEVVQKNVVLSKSVSEKLLYDLLYEVAEEHGLQFKQINKMIFVKPTDNKVKNERPIEIDLTFQERIIEGKVNDETGSPLPGVSILIQGLGKGTITNLDGKFRLSVPSGQNYLIFSYIGYLSKEVEIGNQAEINVDMELDETKLEEVVVTALGIERNKDQLGYATQNLDGKDVNEARETNFVNSLSGKIAGVNVVSNSTVGSSSRITIRGESSLQFQNNQPLFVVDGVPIGNDPVQNTTAADYGNSAAEFNPADIESINVLKGPAASALYGSRAANGVIVIKTKSGKGTPGIGISVNSSVTFEDLLVLPKFQNEFGQGSSGLFEGSNFGYQGNLDLYPNGISDGYDESWGPRLNQGPNRAQFDSPTLNGYRGGDVHLNNRGEIIPTPWVSNPDNVKDFFDQGRTLYNNFAVSGGNEKGNIRLSYTNLNQKGVVPNNNLIRNTFTVNTGYNFTNKLSANFSASYIKTESTNRPDQGYGRNTPMYFMLWMTRQVDINNLRDYWQPGLEGIQQYQYNYGENHNNPFFYQYENTSGQDKDHMFGNVSLTYKILDNLSLRLRTATDLYNDFRPQILAVSTVGVPNGRYTEAKLNFQERNSDFLLTYDFNKRKDWGFSVSIGGNQMHQEKRFESTQAPELLIPGIYNLGNTAAPLIINSSRSSRRINSLYGLARFDFKSKVYLDVTGRNDWSSTLPEDNNAYFYPSVALSAIVSEMLELPDFISLVKFRGGWAQVGNDTEPYQLYNSFGYQRPWAENLALAENSSLKNPQLKPEITTTYEVGADIRFFENRLGLDLTYYDIRSKDQILQIPLAESTGYTGRVINAGEIKNQGVEMVLTATPVVLPNSFKWDITVNFAKNVSEVVELADGIDAVVQSAPGEEATIEARVGERMGATYGPGFVRVPEGPLKGQIIINSNGLPVKTSDVGEAPVYLGNFNPDWTGGVYNNFSFKGFYLGILFDIRQGGKFISRFYNKAIGAGQLEETLVGRAAREVGTEYDDPYYLEGAADMGDGTYQPNLTIFDGTHSEGVYGTSIRNFHKRYHDHNSESQLFDASFVKLRELKIGYQLPNTIMGNLPFRNVSLSVVGRNLKLWTDNPHFDPETGATTGNGLVPGFENMSIPSTRSLGFNLSFNL